MVTLTRRPGTALCVAAVTLALHPAPGTGGITAAFAWRRSGSW